jgi:5-methylcytosine-specific restriction endonuclease McrA
MSSFSRTHLTDQSLLRDLASHLSQHHATTATLLADLAEVDHRKLYRQAAYDSMFEYCVRELHMSEETAFRRIRVARTARQFPAIFPALADGRLNLTAVLLLAPHLTPATTDDLLAAAAHRTKSEVGLLLAGRFPRPDVPTRVQAIAASTGNGELALEPVPPSPRPSSGVQVEPPAPRAKLTPLSPCRFALQVTVDQETYEKLRYAQDLLGHALPSGDVAQVLKRALDALVHKLEKQKFAATARPRETRGAANGRHIPAEVKRTVRERDGGQCTFVSERGTRCEARKRLEYDHIEPVGRGGRSTFTNLRLRCRAHNQFAAECTYGSEFMRGRREAAPRGTVGSETGVKAPEAAREQSAAEAARDKDVIPWLRQLGYNLHRARQGAEACAHIPDATLEERVKVALRALAPMSVRRAVRMTASTA